MVPQLYVVSDQSSIFRMIKVQLKIFSFSRINIHIWFPESPRLAESEQIFCTPWYEGLFIDQSLVMNRRAEKTKNDASRDDDDEEDDYINPAVYFKPSSNSSKSSVKEKDKIR